MSARLIYKQTLTLDSGSIEGLLLSKDSASELSATRLANLKSQSLACSIHVKGGPLYFDVLGNAPSESDPYIEEGDSLDITTNDDMVNVRFKAGGYSVITVHYNGERNPV